MLAGFAAAAAALSVIGGAQAQISGEGPVAVSADSVDYVGNVVVYRGNAEAIQGQTRLRCSELRIILRQRGGSGGGTGGDAERYDCAGPVYYVTPTEQAKGDTAVFTVATDTIVLVGNVVVQQGQNVAQGDRMTINTRTRNTRLESTAAARGSKRVRTIIYPESSRAPQAAAAAPPVRRP